VIKEGITSAGSDPEGLLSRAEEVILPGPHTNPNMVLHHDGPVRVGVDLGTAYTVMVVTDAEGEPLAGEYQFTEVTRDGLIVDYLGAVDILKGMKERLEQRLGCELTHAASGFPPGVPRAEVRATANVVEAAGMSCPDLIDEPSAANNVLKITEGLIVDVGGGTTGIALIEDGKVVYSADEPTGGTHFSLVISGAAGISFEEAEALKKDPAEQTRLFPVVRPVMEKVGTIIKRNINGSKPKSITLVGGTSIFPGMTGVVEEITGIPTFMPSRPMFVTPLGIALQDKQGLS
jgi:ethanolamine utilization protein EutJ